MAERREPKGPRNKSRIMRRNYTILFPKGFQSTVAVRSQPETALHTRNSASSQSTLIDGTELNRDINNVQIICIFSGEGGCNFKSPTTYDVR